MNSKDQIIRNVLLTLGVIIAALVIGFHSSFSQVSGTQALVYKCTPCGCSEDEKLVEGPGTCTACGMVLINTRDPNEGLNYQNIEAGALCRILAENPEVVLLDVRSVMEFENNDERAPGRFKNALNIPVNEVEARIDELEKYKNHEIVVYCSISARSPRASKVLADSGFTRVKNLMGGLILWNRQPESGLPCKNTAKADR